MDYITEKVKLLHGDCLEVLKELPDNSVDSVVADPPYGLAFMGKKWDYDIPSVDIWRECLRVLKPGGHLLSFAGSRTYHRITVAIEDAGFEIRDQIMWVYGSGFPKSMDVSKAIDKAAGAEREVLSERPAYGIGGNGCLNGHAEGATAKVSAPATDAARQWQGWGTALKPSHEPICVARKPLIGTVAANVLEHGTGAINIDGCRVGDEVLPSVTAGQAKIGTFERGVMVTPERVGRWPANFIHDGSEEVTNLLGDAARFFYCSKASKKDRNDGCQGVMTWENVDLQSAQMVVQQLQKATSDISILLQDGCEWSTILFGNEQTARFLPAIKCIIEMATKQTTHSATSNCSVPLNTNDFIRAAIETMKVCGSSPADFAEYTNPSKLNTTCEKTESAAAAVHAVFKMLCDANESAKVGNVHSTVKPTDLMRHLCRLVTPPGGVVLDPFLGSGSTGVAALAEGFRFVGIEREAEYMAIATARIRKAAEAQ